MARKFLNRAVMMEYVIIAVMIAAAVVVAVIMLGRSVTQEFGVATTAMVDPKKAKEVHEEVKKDTKNKREQAEKHANSMHGTGVK
ncbi:MAG: hypothetical protein MJ025_04365 [Victivallaceae bacterium]|nr:hypothetical protein [Victivallaceae bacterium]